MLNTLETLANKLSSGQQNNKGILLDNNGNKLNGLISRSEKTQHQHHYQKESIYHRASPNNTKYTDKWVVNVVFPLILVPVAAHSTWITGKKLFLSLSLPLHRWAGGTCRLATSTWSMSKQALFPQPTHGKLRQGSDTTMMDSRILGKALRLS